MYGGGLRVSEVSNLKVCDIDGARKVIWIREGKGNKDRQVMLSAPLREVLAAYFRWKRPTDWLFPGEKRTARLCAIPFSRPVERQHGQPVS